MPKGKKPRSKKAKFSDSESESGNESDNQQKNQYDATAQIGEDSDMDEDRFDGIEGSDDGEDDEDNWDEDDDADDQDVNDNDDCAYEISRRGRGMSKLIMTVEKNDDEGVEEEEEEEDENDIMDDEEVLNTSKYVAPEDRIADSILTKYEKVRLLGDRTAQLAQRAKPMITGVADMDPRVIAQLELEAKTIPIMINKLRPDGLIEQWKLSELKLKKEFIKYGFTNQHVDVKQINKRTKEIQEGGFITGMTNIHKSELAKTNPRTVNKSNPTSVSAKKIKRAPKKSA